MSLDELIARFIKEHGPIVVALPRSRRGLKSHIFCSDGVHLPGIDRLWDEPLCFARTVLSHCDPQEEQWPTCGQCQARMRTLVEASTCQT